MFFYAGFYCILIHLNILHFTFTVTDSTVIAYIKLNPMNSIKKLAVVSLFRPLSKNTYPEYEGV